MPVQRGREMTVAQWAEELGCRQETLRRAIRRHDLLAKRRPLGRGLPYVIDARDMDTFLAKRRER
jgi:hypothetical protein